MKEYKTSDELIELLISKGIEVPNKKNALKKIKKYSYYSVINSYKDIFKDSNGNYMDNVTFDEIYSLYEFDKNIRTIFIKYILEIEINIKSLISEVLASKYGIKDYLEIANFDTSLKKETLKNSIDKINDEIKKQLESN